MKISTLAYFFREDTMLLGMKKRDFGAGKWNGYGGKLEEGELPVDAIVREIGEECGIRVQKEACKELGFIDFVFDDKEEWNQRVIVYRIDNFDEEPKETEEMIPKWFPVSRLPYDKMWKSDGVWLYKVILGEKFTGRFHLGDTGEKVVSYDIK